MLLVPAIDLRGGRCVRLLQGRFDAETVYSDDPAEVLAAFGAFGARYVHVVDLDAARSGGQQNRDTIGRLLSRGVASVQVGGGIRSREVAERWLALGVRRVVVGSAAATAPEDVERWFGALGADSLVLAFDVRMDPDGVPRITTHGWETQTTTSLWDIVARYAGVGLRHVLCTDVARDGALSGPNVALYSEAVRRFPGIEWQASGGVSSHEDLGALAATGVAAVISGRALLEKRLDPRELGPYLQSA